MRLLRPYIPLEVRCRVALRQIGRGDWETDPLTDGTGNRYRLRPFLDAILMRLAIRLSGTADPEKLHLDHDPALGARVQVWKDDKLIGYEPDANDPLYLIYREKHAHQIKTNVKGDGAQYPDRVLIKRERRRSRSKPKRKYPWPKRKIQSRSSFPKGRKFPQRGEKR